VTIGLITDSLYALAGGSVGDVLRRRPTFARTTRIVSGSIYIALAGVAAVTGTKVTNP
jgi:threonine/homoserine/homoserine lactone efflux protein